MKAVAGDVLHTAPGERLRLGVVLKSGGAGSVHRIEGDELRVAKIYHADVDRAVYARKLEAMLRLSPRLPPIDEGGRRYVQIAWPQALLRDGRGGFQGFLMPAVDVRATAELELVMQERQARAAGLATGLGAKVTLAANLAAVIAELHRQGHRVVDLKPVNLRFYRQSLYMAMLDCDGFSIQGEGERFPAPQYTGDYLAPELQHGGITVSGEEAQDRFALAVIVFQLLNFGIHPFSGRPSDERVPTDVPSRIAARLHAYGLRPNPRLQPSLSSGHAALPSDLRRLFDRAFEDAPAARPTPTEWAESLRGYAQRSRSRLVACQRDVEHQHFAGLPCAACARQALLARMARGDDRPPPAVDSAAPPAPAAGSRLRRRPLPASILKQARGAPRTPMTKAQRPKVRPVQAWGQKPLPASVVRAAASAVQKQRARRALLTILGAFVVVVVLALLNASRPYRPPPQVQFTPAAPATPQAAPAPTLDTLPPAPAFDMVDTGLLARAVAIARAQGRASDAAFSMAALRGERPAPPRTSDDGHLLAFARVALAADAAMTELMRRSAALRVQEDPRDAQATCDWAWLTLAAGKREPARQAFERALWADPHEACGWLGMGAQSVEEAVAIGALRQADDIQRYGGEDARARDAFVAEMLRRGGVDPEAFLAHARQARAPAEGR